MRLLTTTPSTVIRSTCSMSRHGGGNWMIFRRALYDWNTISRHFALFRRRLLLSAHAWICRSSSVHDGVPVVRRDYQVSVIRILNDDIVFMPWPHVGCSDDISSRTETGPLHDAGGNFCNFRYIIPNLVQCPRPEKKFSIQL